MTGGDYNTLVERPTTTLVCKLAKAVTTGVEGIFRSTAARISVDEDDPDRIGVLADFRSNGLTTSVCGLNRNG
ncbi:hypothetical protein [Brevundimonas sp.]|uniref:hypothetical protein n=1 Tax=Brevundimonas sp. TaxID=1871086 RepID=UPI003F71AF26